MLVRSSIQVVLSVGDMPSRVHIVLVKSSACFLVKQDDIFTNPCWRKCCFCSSLRVKSASEIEAGILALLFQWRMGSILFESQLLVWSEGRMVWENQSMVTDGFIWLSAERRAR